MLVLTRKKGERLMIGDDIVVTVIDVRGDGVRIGFDAPRGIKIQRAEVVAAVRAANTEAAASAAETQDLLVGLLNRSRRASDEPAAEPSDVAVQPAPELAVQSQPAAGASSASATAEPARGPGGAPKPRPRKPRA